MKENPIDNVKSGIVERMGWAREKLNKDWKGVKPFNRTPAPDDEVLRIYENMAPEDLNYLISTYGQDAVNQRFYEVEQMKQRRMNNG